MEIFQNEKVGTNPSLHKRFLVLLANEPQLYFISSRVCGKAMFS